MAQRKGSVTQKSHRRGAAARVQAVAYMGVLAVTAWLIFGEHAYVATGFPWFMLLVVVAGLVALLPWRSLRPARPILTELLPVVLLAAAQLVVFEVAVLRIGAGSKLVALLFLIPAAWIATAALGSRAAESGTTPLYAAMGIGGALSALLALFVLGQSLGVDNIVGRTYWELKTSIGIAPVDRGWIVRVVGFDRDPNAFGITGAVMLAVALCVPERRWLRGVLGASAAAIIVLSGSRSAWLAAALCVGVWAVVELRRRRGAVVTTATTRRVLVVGAVVSLCIVLLTLAVSLYLAEPSRSSALADPAGQLEVITSGRAAVWVRALALYREAPLGMFYLPGALIGRSVHNEYLERLVMGGPAFLAVLVIFLTWVALRLRPAKAPALGPCLAAVYAAAALTLGPSMVPAFALLMFFAIGWGRADATAT